MTYLVAKDQQDSLARYCGGQVNAELIIDVRNAINDALRELWGEHTWPWYQGQEVFQLDAPYATGTITYVASTRQFTLTGGTWPTWATYGTILIGIKYARVTKRVSATVIEIEDGTKYLDDIAVASAYTLYRSEYPMQSDIRKMSYMYFEENPWVALKYMPPMEFRGKYPGTASPFAYTVQRDRNVFGGLAIVFMPFPTRAYTARYNYVRAASEVSVWEESAGKVTVTATSPTVAGTNTAFESPLHRGCLLRVGRENINVPTSRSGMYPFSEETLIDAVSSTTSLTVSPVIGISRTAVRYLISSLIDIDEQIMSSAFTQQCYFELAKRRKMSDKDIASINNARMLAIKQAKGKGVTNQEITYAGSFSNMSRYNGTWFSVGV